MTQNKSTNYITKEKRKLLEAELADLKGPKRKKILKDLEYAKSLGDLKENAEYHAARESQGILEERIMKIEQILQSSEVIESVGGDIVQIGSKVVIEKEGTKEKKNYVLVGSEEVDMAEGKISNHSPVGIALFGKKKGDVVSFSTPKGTVNYKIISVA